MKKRDLLRLLIHHSLMKIEKPKWGLVRRLTIVSPMLCASYKDLPLQTRNELLLSDDWVVEPKYYGSRVIICYEPSEGFTIWSRTHDQDTFLPTEFTDKMVLWLNGKPSSPQDWVGVFEKSFVLDGLIYSKSSLRKQEEKYLGLERNSVSLVLSSDPQESIELQLSDIPLSICVFDILYLGNKSVWNSPLGERKKILNELFESKHLPFFKIEYRNKGKLDYYHELISLGMEGVIFKNLNMPYEATGRRKRTHMVRLKQRMYTEHKEEIDAFILDSRSASNGSPGSAFIKSLILGIYLVDDRGIENEHAIAEVSPLPFQIRSEMTEHFPFSRTIEPVLKKDYHGKVLTFRGEKFDPRRIWFNEAKVDWFKGVRSDKERFDCCLSKTEFLQKLA